MKQKKNAPGRAQQEYMAAEEKLRAGNGAVEQDSLRGEVYDWIQCVVAALVVCVLLFSFAVRLVDVVGNSMYPTLENGDKVIVSNLFYEPELYEALVRFLFSGTPCCGVLEPPAGEEGLTLRELLAGDPDTMLLETSGKYDANAEGALRHWAEEYVFAPVAARW